MFKEVILKNCSGNFFNSFHTAKLSLKCCDALLVCVGMHMLCSRVSSYAIHAVGYVSGYFLQVL